MPFSHKIQTRLSLCASIAVLALASASVAQVPETMPHNRILGPVTDSDVVTLTGNVHPLARPENDRGMIDDETRLDSMVLLLAPDAGQQKALDALTEAQQNPESPLYRQWLTPEEYGSRFGASLADIARIAAWLSGHGFHVDEVPAGRRSILFSGTAAQVADTFHTEIHSFAVDGQMHIANTEDPQIPRALASVVSGILSLHDFRRISATRSIHPVADPLASERSARPENTQGSTHYVFPADLATIYDLNPQYTAAKNGAGVSIAIVGRSNINLSDVSSFRSGSGLSANQPSVVLVSTNPGLVSGDQDESTLDVEWSGAMAPGAAVKFVVGASTNTSDGVDLSAQYIVNHNTAQIVSTSYGNCEAYMGSGELSFYNSLWQQAATEGMSSFVSSGDSGAAGCNGGGSSSGSMAGVNGLCSSPYSTCVGGTEFNEGSGNWWSATNGAGGGSALGYIPEKVWNESASDGGSGLWSSGGGASIAYTQPSWQAGVAGANHNGMRLVPDVALTAASHDGYIIYENGNWYVIAGTSAASPSFAGIMAVVDQKHGGTGLGNANPGLYGMLSAAQNPFHATPTGNNSVPGVTGFTASGTAYNPATGLGSVDANLLANGWGSANGGGGATQSFTLHASAASETLVKGKSATFTVSVTGAGGFTGSANLTATTPSGVTLSFSPAAVKAGASATATLTVSSAAAAGSATITITGTSGSIVATTTVGLTISSTPSLSVSAASAKVVVVRGKSATLALTATTGGSYTGAVTLAVTGLPSGVTASWTNGTFTDSGAASTSSTLTLKATTTAVLTSAALTITASGDGLKSTASSAVQVAAAPTVTLSMSPASISMKSNASQQVVVTATPVGGAVLPASGATFQITGLPTGISGSWGAQNLTASGNLQVTLTITGSNSAIGTSSKPTVTAHITDASTGTVYMATEQATLSVTRVLLYKPMAIVAKYGTPKLQQR